MKTHVRWAVAISLVLLLAVAQAAWTLDGEVSPIQNNDDTNDIPRLQRRYSLPADLKNFDRSALEPLQIPKKMSPKDVQDMNDKLKEIVTSEVKFLTNLEYLQKYAMAPLGINVNKDVEIVNHEEWMTLFAGIGKIIQTSLTILPHLQDGLRNGNLVEVMIGLAPTIEKNYAPYMKRYEMDMLKISDILKKPEVAKFSNLFKLQSAKGLQKNGLSLKDILIQPVQRVPRYKLFMQDLARYIPLAAKAETVYFALGKRINEAIRKRHEEEAEKKKQEEMKNRGIRGVFNKLTGKLGFGKQNTLSYRRREYDDEYDDPRYRRGRSHMYRYY